MVVAHLSDTHLGYRAYAKSDGHGRNLRERDVMDAFARTLDDILRHSPDLVLHAGDFFHVVRPTNGVIVEAFQKLRAFQAARNNAPFVLIGGNHDTPRLSEGGNILRLFAALPGFHVAAEEAEVIDLPEIDTEVVALPHRSLATREDKPRPTGRRPRSVLAIHGAASGLLPDKGEFDVDPLLIEDWHYVALGDYHEPKFYAPNAAYAGATERTTSDVWAEADRPRGWMLFDGHRAVHQPIPGRTVIDLPPLDAASRDAKGLQEVLEAAAAGLPEGAVVRQKVRNVLPSLRRDLDPTLGRRLSTGLLAYRLDLRPPEREEREAFGARGKARSLEEIWEGWLGERLPAGPERERAVALGRDLLREAEEAYASA